MTDLDIIDDLFLDEGAPKIVDKGRKKYQPRGKKESRPATVLRPAVISEASVSNSGGNVDKDGPVNESFSIPSSNHLEEKISENASALDVTERSKDASSPLGAGKSSELVASETTLVRHSGPDEEGTDLFLSTGLGDLLCQTAASSGKVARKFQPKGSMQDKNEKLSQPFGCIFDGTERANVSTLAMCDSASFNTNSELHSGSTSRNDQDTLNVSKASTLPSSPWTSSNSSFLSSPILDDGNAYDIPRAEHVLSDHNRDSVREIEKLDAKNADEQVAEPFEDILSESLSSIARGVGKFRPKPRSGELTVKSKQPSKVANLAAAGSGDVNGECFRSFSTNQLQEEHTQNNSELDVAPQNSNGSMRPSRKRKKASEERNPTEQDPPKKKFSHSTRRKRRQVEKTLLETPEEEIDSRKLCIRDLIMLSEARERMSVKSGSVGLSGDNRRNDVDPSSNSNYYDDENAYTGGQDFNPEDEDANHEVDASAVKLNYHSYMKKSGRERWTKTDMELFYQAIRQFGTDFAMIQQLFPNRTRHQVHLKFKSEERKHPLQIADALVHRSKDYSHFKQVIEQLKTKAEKDAADEPTSEYQDAVTTAPDEVGGVKKFDGEDQEIHDSYYDDGPTKYDDEEAYDWNEYDKSDAQYKFDDDY